MLVKNVHKGGNPKAILTKTIDSEAKQKISELLIQLGLLPLGNCQIILHCRNGKVNSMKLWKLKLL
ncbi:MAG: hypothetical protein ACLP29_13495 [Dissulfurispiraceae bacterium]